MINLWLRTDTGMVSLSLNWIDVQNLDFYHLFLERHHLMWLAKSHSKDKALAIALKAHPEVLWYFKRLLPEAAEVFEDMTGSVSPDLSGEEIRRAEIEVMRSINDWMVYLVDPAIYDRLEFTRWDDSELTDFVDFSGRRVVDIGAGTGRLSFVAASRGATVYAVEPVRTLRDYLKRKAETIGYKRFYVVDGLIEEIPFEDDFADIVISGHVFGDFPDREYGEMVRVVRNGGNIVLFPGNNDTDNEIHDFLAGKGFDWGRFEEPGTGFVRKYRLKVEKRSL